MAKWQEFYLWIPIETIIHERQQDYYNALNASNTDGESTIFVAFMLELIRDLLGELASGRAFIGEKTTDDKVLELIKEDGKLSAAKMGEHLGMSTRQIQRILKQLKAGGIVMKKILVVQGGGRANGNTAQLVSHFVKGAEESGHSVEVISLVKNEVKGCLGCNACRYGKPCVQKDAFNDIVPKIKAADCVAFASPLYFWTVSSRIKAFIERFYCIAEEDANPPLGRYEKYLVKDCALLMTSADNFFWTFEQAVSYYQFTLVHYIGFHDRGMVLAGGCGDTNGKPQIDQTAYLQKAYEFGKGIYDEE